MVKNVTYTKRPTNSRPKQLNWDIWYIRINLNLNVWCLTPLSTIFQLYHGDPFLWWRKPDYPERTTDHWQTTGKLYHLWLWVECTFCNLQSWAWTLAVLVICLYEMLDRCHWATRIPIRIKSMLLFEIGVMINSNVLRLQERGKYYHIYFVRSDFSCNWFITC
jgi:hypothetical protein